MPTQSFWSPIDFLLSWGEFLSCLSHNYKSVKLEVLDRCCVHVVAEYSVLVFDHMEKDSVLVFLLVAAELFLYV